MKKLRIFSISLFIVTAIAFGIFQIYIRIIQDTTPPVVICETDEITVPVTTPVEDLLKGVKAEDRKCGDVTDTVVIEQMSDFTEEGTRILTYAAVDESKNVGRCERILKYEGYMEPEFNLDAPLTYVIGSKIDLKNAVTAESVLDGDLSSNIKYTLESTIKSMEEGAYPIEFRVMDSAGKIVYLKTEVEIFGREYLGINVNLKEYLVYVNKGQPFNAKEYYDNASIPDVTLSIKSNVNTAEEGTYYVDYIVSSGALKGKSRLLVVVR